jgi:hypothetical protein
VLHPLPSLFEMTPHSQHEPPDSVVFALSEALELLATLEEARLVIRDTDHLSVLAQIENELGLLNRRLGFDDPQGGIDA